MKISIQLLDDEELKRLDKVIFESVLRALRVASAQGLLKDWKVSEAVAQSVKAVVAPTPSIPPVSLPEPKPIPVPRVSFADKVRKLVKTVGERPAGYVTTDEAAKLVGVTAADATVRRWVLNREVSALIVANYKPPTKGLPGRLMVLKSEVVERDKVRQRNLETLPALKRWKVNGQETSTASDRV